MQHFKT